MQLQKRNNNCSSRSNCSSSYTSSVSTLLSLQLPSPLQLSLHLQLLLLLLFLSYSCSTPATHGQTLPGAACCFATFYAFELGIYEIAPRQRSKSTHNSLYCPHSWCGTKNNKGRRSSSRRRREQQKCHLFVNLPTQHQICEVNKTKGRQQDNQTAQVSEAEADAGYAGAGAHHGNVRRKRF